MMKTQGKLEPLEEKIDPENISVVLAEYNNLRAEILKRIELRHQLVSLAIIAPGTIIAVGFQTHNAFLMLSYPILACFLSSIWIANTHGNHELAHYIRTQIEPKLGRNNLGWQHFNFAAKRPFRFIGILGSGAIFIFTELLALLAGLTVTTFSLSEILILIFAVISVIANILMIIQLERQRLR